MGEYVEAGLLVLVSRDPRRVISERGFRNGQRVLLFKINDSTQPLGQHYHEVGTETFYIHEGGGVIYTAQVGEEGKIVGEVKRFPVAAGSVIRIPPNHAHRFDLRPGTQMVAYCSHPFVASDQIPCPIPVG